VRHARARRLSSSRSRIVDAEQRQALGKPVEIFEVATAPAAAAGDHARHVLELWRHIAVGRAVDGEGERHVDEGFWGMQDCRTGRETCRGCGPPVREPAQ